MFSFTRIKADEDRHLDAWYATYNHMYFQDRLPKTTVITRNLTDDRFMAQTFYENNFYHIAINPRYNESRKTEKLNLLHESCHIEVFIDKEEDEFDDHGEHWQRCMHRLADEKAFENLW
jgi:hypothetical protein